MRIALLGAGRIGSAHAANLRAHPEVSSLLIADAVEQCARDTAQQVGAQAVTVDDAFASGPDAVVIATPTATHAELIVRAVTAGIPAFCEKPVAADLKQTGEVVRRVAESGAQVQIGFQQCTERPGHTTSPPKSMRCLATVGATSWTSKRCAETSSPRRQPNPTAQELAVVAERAALSVGDQLRAAFRSPSGDGVQTRPARSRDRARPRRRGDHP